MQLSNFQPKDRMKMNELWREDMDIPIEHQKKIRIELLNKKKPETELEGNGK